MNQAIKVDIKEISYQEEVERQTINWIIVIAFFFSPLLVTETEERKQMRD